MYKKRYLSPPRISNEEFSLYLARTALEKFRKERYTLWFPSLRNFLKLQNEGKKEITNFSLVGGRFTEDLGLTSEEYSDFEAEYEAARESRKLLRPPTR